MADATKAENDAQKALFKEWFKEALGEWQAEETTRRTEAEKNAPKKPGGFFDGFFGS